MIKSSQNLDWMGKHEISVVRVVAGVKEYGLTGRQPGVVWLDDLLYSRHVPIGGNLRELNQGSDSGLVPSKSASL